MSITEKTLNKSRELTDKFKLIPSLIESNIKNSDIDYLKKGNKIHIKKENRGKFTEYCGGNVTNECILRGKNSPDPKVRKRATFAANSRRWAK